MLPTLQQWPRTLTVVHDVGLVAVDEELEAVADDEDEDDADEHGRHVHVPPLSRRHRRKHLVFVGSFGG